jgi:hypothetical protein
MQWWSARNVGNGSWHPIEAEDAEKLVSAEDMLQLSTWLSELFFHGQFAGLKINWDRDIEWIGQATTYDSGSVLISMHPSKWMNDFGRHTLLEILSTLLHEVLHIFLSKHGCFDCKTAEFAKSCRRHGRPFQLILAKLQEVAPRLLGIPLKLDGFHSIAEAWQLMTELPSRHDIMLYNFSNVLLASDYTGDTSDLLERMHHMHSYLPRRRSNSTGNAC